jgi:tetratricopeptide (TPR) repeat protein
VQRKLPNKTVYYERGLVYQKMGNHQLAIADFNKAISMKKNCSQSLFCRGVSRLHISSSMETMYAPDKHANCEPEMVDGVENVRHVCEEGNLNELKSRLPLTLAIKDFKDALQTGDENPEIYDGLGRCY